MISSTQGYEQTNSNGLDFQNYSENSEYPYTSTSVENSEGIKLFVGQIPKDMNEDLLHPFFLEFGPIMELTIIRDKASKLHRGCAFLTYANKQSALRAIETLHDKVKLPNALNPLQIRPAESQSERENKIFVGMLPKTTSELDLHDMFARYGQLKEIHIIRGPEGQSKGCAFVKFLEREAAYLAIHELNNTVPEGSTRPLVIKFADSKKAVNGGVSGRLGSEYYERDENDDTIEDGGRGNISIRDHDPKKSSNDADNYRKPVGGYQPQSSGSNAGFPYSIPPINVNPIMHQNIPYVQYSPGSPVVQPYMFYAAGGYYSPYGLDSNAIQHLQMSPGRSRSNSKSHRSRTSSDEQAISQRPTTVPVTLPQNDGAGHAVDQVLQGSSLITNPHVDANEDSSGKPVEGPVGANIFIYHLPRDLTDADLATLFAPFGNVISAKVYVDKRTAESKGFGFVSYDAVESAEAAIGAMNGFQIGTKRLKVQHKRTNFAGNNYSSSSISGNGQYVHPSSLSMSYPVVSQLTPQQQADYARSLEEQQLQMMSMYHNASMQQIAYQQQQQYYQKQGAPQNYLVSNKHYNATNKTSNVTSKGGASNMETRGPDGDSTKHVYDMSQSFQKFNIRDGHS